MFDNQKHTFYNDLTRKAEKLCLVGNDYSNIRKQTEYLNPKFRFGYTRFKEIN